MEIYGLINKYYQHHPTGHYFDDTTLRFFGERKSEMRVLKGTIKVTDICGDEHECYMVSSVQHKAPGGAKRHYAYFDTTTFDHVVR